MLFKALAHLPHRATRLTIALTLAAALALIGAAASLASTGSVYYDSNLNVAAGQSFFNGTFTGVDNTGLGYLVMPALTSGSYNTGLGVGGLQGVTSGSNNTAAGRSALGANDTGNRNVAAGDLALGDNRAGNDNVAAGTRALALNDAGSDNVAAGSEALFNNTGDSNLGLGSNAGSNLTTGSNNIDIANAGVAGESGKIRIGTKGKQSAAYLQGVYGKTAASGAPVYVNSAGKLGTNTGAAARQAQPLSVRAGRRLLAELKRQQREIRRLRQEVLGSR
jgi:hypothetical protein